MARLLTFTVTTTWSDGSWRCHRAGQSPCHRASASIQTEVAGMSRDDYVVAAAALNGRPQRLVSVDRSDGVSFRDQINVDSAISRQRFVGRARDRFGVEIDELAWLDDAIVTAADDADTRADEAVGQLPAAERKSQATQLVEFGTQAELFYD